MAVLNKFDPSKTMYFRGFSGIDSPAALHSASATGFTVSGIFRKAAAFWVLVLFDIDDYFGHPRIKALPASDLTGIVLEFDVTFSGAAGYDCPKFPTIDWPFLDYILMDGTMGRIDLSVGNFQSSHGGGGTANPNATTITSGTHGAASCVFGVNTSGAAFGDYLTLWFQNSSWTWTYLTMTQSDFVNLINATSWGSNLYQLQAAGGGGGITITASPAGVDGNMIRLYSIASNPSGFSLVPAGQQLAGGSSAVTYHVKLDFSSLGLTDVRQLWLTFAPLLADSANYADTQADIIVTNWGATADPHGLMPLAAAGPGSVRIEESDVWTTFAGNWSRTDVGWFSNGFAAVSGTPADSVMVTYWCPHVHDLWLGTYLALGGGTFATTVDGVAAASIDTALATTEEISTRRQVATGLTAGQHTVVLTISGGNGYFDFLEACVASDVPAAPGPWADRSPAIDFDTQHGYQLAPARLLWMLDALGFTGPMYLYSGVFWLNQRKATGRTLAGLTMDFATLPALTPGTASISIDIAGTIISKSVYQHETAATWAAHFAYFVNETFSGVWASFAGTVLTITTRDDTAAYAVTPVSASYQNGGSPVAISTSAPDLTGSVPGIWEIDTTQTPALNYAAAAWHADFFAGVHARGNVVGTALSMELVYPPDANIVGQVWAARFQNGQTVQTSTGFANTLSTQCAPMATAFLAYQIAMFKHLADLQASAGLIPYLICGEFLWWFFSQLWLRPVGSVAILAYVRLGFAQPHGLVPAQLLAVQNLQGIPSINGTWSVIAVPDSTHVDISAPYGGGSWVVGTGTASGGSMAFYDLETTTAANSALGHPLATFTFPTDTPVLPDALFLANRLAAHVAAIIAAVVATYPAAVFGLLWPGDVNGSSVAPLSQVGGALNSFVNFPATWQAQASAPFQIFWLEALAFSTTDRNVDFMKATLARVLGLAWPLAQLRFLYSVDNAGVALWSDYRLAKSAGLAHLTPFAIDQMCLLGWRLDPPAEEASVSVT
jgi:hypothetical protein